MKKTIDSKVKSKEEIPEMPRTHLEEHSNIVVEVNNQVDYDRLMQLYEAAGWAWTDGDNPTDFLNTIKKKVYIEARDNFGYIDNKKNLGKRIGISLGKFYEFENFENLAYVQEINRWFNKYKPNRGSLGKSGVGEDKK
jgi:hypothetical protein